MRTAYTVRETLTAACCQYGFQPSTEMTERMTEASLRCRSCTYTVHQYRHIKKSQEQDFETNGLAASKTSMLAHLSTYADLPVRLKVAQLENAVQERILSK